MSFIWAFPFLKKEKGRPARLKDVSRSGGAFRSNLCFRKIAEAKDFVEFTLSVPVVSVCRTIEGIPNATLNNDGEILRFYWASDRKNDRTQVNKDSHPIQV